MTSGRKFVQDQNCFQDIARALAVVGFYFLLQLNRFRTGGVS
jgi:hypothetical protein